MAQSTKYCYYCGEPAVGKEHIPPQSLFPKGHRKHLIRVPSCAEHNTNKSGEDEYFINIIRTSTHINAIGVQESEKAVRSFKRNNKNLKNILKDPQLIKYEGNSTMIYHVDNQRLKIYFTHLAKGLYYYINKTIFQGEIDSIFVTLLQDAPPNEDIIKILKLINSKFQTADKQGENPEIFYYQMDGNELLLTIYEGVKIYLKFNN